ncbi:MAG: ABC transporter permease, partial [Gammaproteobacteria bacterium]|nr:ABC transporter permease [Gammaproteobacteria bacterium]
MDAITGWWDDYFWGSLVVVELFFVALALTILFGLIGAGAKLSKSRVAKAIASGYTIIFRGTPEIL